MFDLSIGLGELIFRVTVVYCFLFALLRLTGKRHVGELAPFDLVVLLILSETVQGALLAGDNSLIGGLVAAAALVLISHAVSYASWRYRKFERFFEGTPRILVRNGHVLNEMLARERVTHSELVEALRREGCSSFSNVRFAVLENDGSITVGLRCKRN
jgi:uncharacterized membrane protein YcaP (DUF421 family)